MKCVLKLFGWRFFLKPEGLELAFLNTWNLSLLSFFLFFVLNIQSERSCLIGLNLKEWVLNWKMVVFGKCVKFLGTDEKTISKNKNAFHPALKFYTLSFARVYCFFLVKRNGLFYWNCSWWPFLGFDFWGCLIVLWNEKFQFKRNVVLKMESIFKKQCIIIPSATVQ